MKIAVIGASGWLGGAIAREAVGRGHEVTAIGRNVSRLAQVEGAGAVVADLDDPESIVDAIKGSDVVVSSVTDRTTADRSRIPVTARQLLDLAPRAGIRRVALVGGGGSLEIEPGLPDQVPVMVSWRPRTGPASRCQCRARPGRGASGAWRSGRARPDPGPRRTGRSAQEGAGSG